MTKLICRERIKKELVLRSSFIFLICFVLLSCDGWFNQLVKNYSKDSEILTMVVDSEYKTCQGLVQRQCLFISEDGGAFELFYTSIKGFYNDHKADPLEIYQEGYEYVIKVKRTYVMNPPQDVSSFKYELIEVVSKTKKE